MYLCPIFVDIEEGFGSFEARINSKDFGSNSIYSFPDS